MRFAEYAHVLASKGMQTPVFDWSILPSGFNRLSYPQSSLLAAIISRGFNRCLIAVFRLLVVDVDWVLYMISCALPKGETLLRSRANTMAFQHGFPRQAAP